MSQNVSLDTIFEVKVGENSTPKCLATTKKKKMLATALFGQVTLLNTYSEVLSNYYICKKKSLRSGL